MKMGKGQASWWAKGHFRIAARLYEESNMHDDFDIVMHLHAAAHHHNVLGGKYRDHAEVDDEPDMLMQPNDCTCTVRTDDDGTVLEVININETCPVH